MQIKIEPLDRRHSGNLRFSHRVWIYGEDRIENFNTIRNWCWEVWGPSCERDDAIKLFHAKNPLHNPQWAWYTDAFERYIYLVDDQALAFFKLKWL